MADVSQIDQVETRTGDAWSGDVFGITKDAVGRFLAAYAEAIGEAKDLESSLASCRAQLDEARVQIRRLMQVLRPFADHGHPTHWRDRPTDYEASVVVSIGGEHVLRVSDLLRAHAIYHDVRKELGW